MDAGPADRRKPPAPSQSRVTAPAHRDLDDNTAREIARLRAEADRLIARVDELIAHRLAECHRSPGHPGAA